MITKPFEDFVGKPRQKLYDHLIKEGYKLADEEDLEECIKNPPEYMKDGNWYYFFGTIRRDRDGRARVPGVGWRGGLGRGAGWLEDDWSSRDRVVLKETSEYCECKRCPNCNKIIK